MIRPVLELRVEAIGGSGITETAEAMTTLARALQLTVVCEFQPGKTLTATPNSTDEQVILQFTGQTFHSGVQPAASGTNNPLIAKRIKDDNERYARRARLMDRFETTVQNILVEIGNLRDLFQDK